MNTYRVKLRLVKNGSSSKRRFTEIHEETTLQELKNFLADNLANENVEADEIKLYVNNCLLQQDGSRTLKSLKIPTKKVIKALVTDDIQDNVVLPLEGYTRRLLSYDALKYKNRPDLSDDTILFSRSKEVISLSRWPIALDPNSLFTSLDVCMMGVEVDDSAAYVREYIAKSLRDDPDEFRDLDFGGIDPKSYAKEIVKASTWGTFSDVDVFSVVADVHQFHVLFRDSSTNQVVCRSSPDRHETCCYLLFDQTNNRFEPIFQNLKKAKRKFKFDYNDCDVRGAAFLLADKILPRIVLRKRRLQSYDPNDNVSKKPQLLPRCA